MATLTKERLERARASTQFKDGKFHNTAEISLSLKGPTLPVIGEFIFGGSARRPPAPLPIESPLEAWATAPASSSLRVTWLGHSTMLLEIDGLPVLTVRFLGRRPSPFSFAAPRRFHPVPVTIEQLPPLDAV